jgi:predicted dithiol-disulfide oxidoreductase (DUF899 family)
MFHHLLYTELECARTRDAPPPRKCAYARAGDIFLGTYVLLDASQQGRDKTGPGHNLTDWVRHHDRDRRANGAFGLLCRYRGP